MVLRSSREQTNRPRQSGNVHVFEVPGDASECELPYWADFTEFVKDNVEARCAVQRTRSGRPADQLPWYDQKFSSMIALPNAQG
eukprot:1200778-Alexandrium_andersonii.AAC.1